MAKRIIIVQDLFGIRQLLRWGRLSGSFAYLSDLDDLCLGVLGGRAYWVLGGGFNLGVGTAQNFFWGGFGRNSRVVFRDQVKRLT